VSFAAGSLIGGALFHMIPAALLVLPVKSSLGWVALGFLVFFGLEQFLHWHHCHRAFAGCRKPLTYLILVGEHRKHESDIGAVVAPPRTGGDRPACSRGGRIGRLSRARRRTRTGITIHARREAVRPRAHDCATRSSPSWGGEGGARACARVSPARIGVAAAGSVTADRIRMSSFCGYDGDYRLSDASAILHCDLNNYDAGRLVDAGDVTGDEIDDGFLAVAVDERHLWCIRTMSAS
jgi:hypothetical protein